jgi:hypothetical protein
MRPDGRSPGRWQEADPRGGPTNGGERPTGGSQTQTGHIAAGSGDQTVSVTLKGLQWGYTYWYGVRAVNSACNTRGQSPYTFSLHISGEFPDGRGTGPPYETEIPCWSTKVSEELSAQTKGAKGAKGGKNARTVRIGTADLSISGDQAKTIKVNLNAAGRALLSADHGRTGASLAILELAPSPENIQTKTVHLVRQQQHYGGRAR